MSWTPLLAPPTSRRLHPYANLLWNVNLGGKVKGRRYPQQKGCQRVAGEAQPIRPGKEVLPPALPWDLQAMGSRQLLIRASGLEAVAKETVLKCILLPLSSDSTQKAVSSHPCYHSLPAQGFKSHGDWQLLPALGRSYLPYPFFWPRSFLETIGPPPRHVCPTPKACSPHHKMSGYPISSCTP